MAKASSSRPQKKQLAVELGDRSLQLCVEGNTTIASLKTIVEAREGLPSTLQKLYKGHRLLQDWMSVGDREGTCDATHQLRLALSIPGGGEQSADGSGDQGSNVNPAAGLPPDPREWTAEHVATWVQRCGQKYHIEDLDLRRFHMNGRGLCLMSLSGFNYRVPDRGEQLYLDFRSLLANL